MISTLNFLFRNEMDDELAVALGRVVSEIRNLISVTFDFCGYFIEF